MFGKFFWQRGYKLQKTAITTTFTIISNLFPLAAALEDFAFLLLFAIPQFECKLRKAFTSALLIRKMQIPLKCFEFFGADKN